MGSEEPSPAQNGSPKPGASVKPTKGKGRMRGKEAASSKRKCVSTACIACRRRKSKCDGTLPSCAACASVYGTECVYDPSSDHRRKGVYKKDIDQLKTRNSTLQTLVHGILSYPEDEVSDLVRQIRSCESLDDVADAILAHGLDARDDADEDEELSMDEGAPEMVSFEKELSGKMGGLQLEDGTIRFVGGTSNLLFHPTESPEPSISAAPSDVQQYPRQEDAVRSWTTVTGDAEVIFHLLNMYFTWHYQYFTTLSKHMFFRDFFRGKPVHGRRKNEHCTSLLVNAMLSLGCHFTAWPAARADPSDSGTAGDHFFKEAKRLIMDDDEYEHPRLATVQALALMSVREAGCGREQKGWVYSGMSFRMACDLGLNVKIENTSLEEHEIDARRVTFWGCFLFDKCWSNYLGRPPQLPLTNITVGKFDVFPAEDSEAWSPWTDSGIDQTYQQPARTRAVALLISSLCEISNDILLAFYRPSQVEKGLTKQAEVKRLSELHRRLEDWRKQLPKELEPREGQLPHVLLMHMFFNLLFMHLFRPFLKYSQPNGPLPAQVQPRRICTQAATMISKLLRLYRRTHGLRRICNVAVYIAHSACTIHILNLPDKDAKRDIVHGLRHLDEIAEGWLCARRTLLILGNQAQRWRIELPEEAIGVLQRAEEKWSSAPSPRSSSDGSTMYMMSQRNMQPMTVPLGNGTSLASGPNSRPHANAAGGGEQAPNQNTGPSYLFNNVYGQAVHGTLDPSGVPTNAASSPNKSTQSPLAVLAGPHMTTVDSKDWWIRDQSAIFDNWTTRGVPSTAGSAGNGLQSPGNLELGVGGGAGVTSAGQLDGFNGMDIIKEDLTADGYNLEYLDFGQNGMYPYPISDD